MRKPYIVGKIEIQEEVIYAIKVNMHMTHNAFILARWDAEVNRWITTQGSWVYCEKVVDCRMFEVF